MLDRTPFGVLWLVGVSLVYSKWRRQRIIRSTYLRVVLRACAGSENLTERVADTIELISVGVADTARDASWCSFDMA
jgi:hypothetical protein